MAQFEFYASTGFVGCKRSEIVEIYDEHLEGLTETEKEKVIEEYFNEWLWNNIEAGWIEK